METIFKAALFTSLPGAFFFLTDKEAKTHAKKNSLSSDSFLAGHPLKRIQSGKKRNKSWLVEVCNSGQIL